MNRFTGTTSLDAVSPATAAEMLHERGVGLMAVRGDIGMSECLCRAAGETGIRIRQLPDDFDAVRAELHRLWERQERAGRSDECARYRPVSMEQP